MSEVSGCTSFACDSFALIITVLQLGQFIPQHLEMAIEKSVVGVSPWLLFFGSLYSHLAALDIAMTGSAEVLSCSASAYRCFIQAQPLLQMIGSAILSTSMWYWFLKYHHDSAESMDENELVLRSNFFYSLLSARHFFYVFLSLGTISSVWAVAIVVFYGPASPVTRTFAYSCGLISAVLNAIMWVPQIFVTFAYRHKGAVSLGWVFSSIVMDVVYSVYLAAVGVDFSVWANNIPDAVQTGILLAMILYFEYQDDVLGLDPFGRQSAADEDCREDLLPRKSSGSSMSVYEAI